MAKLLILEDDTLLNKALTTFLKKNGHEVISCHNATEAYDVLYSNIFDLIISDIMMPDIDGLEFLETIRENDSEIPIIFVTAKEDFKTKQQGYRLGVDDYLVKPVDFDELELKIGAICRRAKIASSKKLVVGKTVLDTDERIATVDSEEVQLSVREFDILFKLLSYPKKTFTRSRLM